ncbi:tyrosine-type recombinase/integrase [Candidatus Margulisiibacteriota bacterium]
MNELEYLNNSEVKALLRVLKDPRDLAVIQLLLSAGLYLNEISELNIDSVDWEKKVLQIKGTRERAIPINDVLYEALVAWSHERLDNPEKALFITSKGKPGRLSSRAIDKLIRKYGEDAGLQKKVSAQTLRNTFAVHLFANEVSIDNASSILGISSPKSLRRYIKAAQLEKEGKVPRKEVEKLDKRPKIVQEISKLMQRKPKEAKVIKPVSKQVVGERVTIGRNSVLNDIRENLAKERSTILVGDIGMGKTHLLKVIGEEKACLYLDSPTPIKQFLQKLCEKYCPDWTQRLPNKARSSAKEIVELLANLQKDKEKKEILIIDNLGKLKISDLEVFLVLLDSFIVMASADTTSKKLKQIWWKFRRIDLPPLTTEAEKEFIKHLTSGLTITDYKLLEARILSLAGGLPLSIVEMVNQISGRPVVKNEDVRDLYHESGVRYRDWTLILVVLWGMAMISRFIALGTHSFELYILAGFAVVSLRTITKLVATLFRRT